MSPRVPRNLLVSFEVKTIKPYQRTTSDLEHFVQALYLQGLTLSETIERLMGRSSTDLSRESVRKLTAKLAKEAEEFRSQALPECVVVIMDGAYVPPKKGTTALIVLAKVYEDYNRNARPAKFMLDPGEEEKDSMGFKRGLEGGRAAWKFHKNLATLRHEPGNKGALATTSSFFAPIWSPSLS